MIMGFVNRSITCSNNDGVSITFAERGLTPFLLVNAEGCYMASNTVTISQNTMTDGGAYQGSVAKVRNIVLTLKDNSNHVYNRNLLEALFKSKTPGKLVFSEDENQREINYYVESVNSTGQYGARVYTISLLCPDPFFYAMDDITVLLAAWVDNFEFIHEFISTGEEFGYRSAERSKNIPNENAENGIGMVITLSASGTVTNPSVVRVESNESITIGTVSNPFTMLSGDIVTITTTDNDKHVYLRRNGVVTEINQYITEDSVFIQLMRGNNNIGYTAESGEDALSVRIAYRLKFAGA